MDDGCGGIMWSVGVNKSEKSSNFCYIPLSSRVVAVGHVGSHRSLMLPLADDQGYCLLRGMTRRERDAPCVPHSILSVSSFETGSHIFQHPMIAANRLSLFCLFFAPVPLALPLTMTFWQNAMTKWTKTQQMDEDNDFR
jgi:hypothetical protein